MTILVDLETKEELEMPTVEFYMQRLAVLMEKKTELTQSDNEDKPTIVRDRFPFKEFFTNTPQPVFTVESFERDMRAAKGCFCHLKTIFQELEECRAFELLKSTADRANYLMTKQAKIVAMTCTHAALKKKDFLQLGFCWESRSTTRI